MAVFALNLIGADISGDKDVRAPLIPPAFNRGTATLGSDGCKYVYARMTGGAAPAGTRVGIVLSAGAASVAANGHYISVPTNIASGGHGWFRAVENYTAAAGDDASVS